MDDTQFWQLIEISRTENADCDTQAAQLTDLLAQLSPGEIATFDTLLYRYRREAYRWDLRGAAYLINGGSSDDGFAYFCGWLIGQGKSAYEAALADPDSLSDLITNAMMEEGEVECEALLYAGGDAYERVTGEHLPARTEAFPSEPAGERWNEDDLDTLYPKLGSRC